MFRRLPYLTPAVLDACSVTCGLFMAHNLKWTGLVVWFFFVFIPTTQLSQPTIVKGDSRSTCGAFMGSLVSFTFSYKMYVSHTVTHWTNLFLVGFSLISVILFFQIMISIPENISSSPTSALDRRNKLLDSLIRDPETTQFCTSCMVLSARNVVHCSRCNACVVDIDNHCPALMNCVGKGNRRMFVLLLLLGIVISMVYTVSVFHAEKLVYCPGLQGIFWGFFPVQYCISSQNPALFLTFFCSLAMLVVCFNNFIMELYFISIKTTIYNVMNRDHDGRCHEGYDNGFRTLNIFFRTGQYKIIHHPVVYTSPNDSISGHNHQRCCQNIPIKPDVAELGQSFSIGE
jgi:hypothetical protein